LVDAMVVAALAVVRRPASPSLYLNALLVGTRDHLVPNHLRPLDFLDVVKPMLLIINYGTSRILVRVLIKVVIRIGLWIAALMVVMQSIFEDLACLGVDLLDLVSMLIL